jgi:hypothetical protein
MHVRQNRLPIRLSEIKLIHRKIDVRNVTLDRLYATDRFVASGTDEVDDVAVLGMVTGFGHQRTEASVDCSSNHRLLSGGG